MFRGTMKIFVLMLTGVFLLGGCDSGYQIAQQNVSIEMPNKSIDENENFVLLSTQYFNKQLSLNPIYALYAGDYSKNSLFVDNLTDDYLKQRHEINALYFAYLNGLSRDKLTNKNQISFDILKISLQTTREAEAFPEYYLPFSQFDSLMSTMAQLGSGQGAQPFSTVADYDDFLKRLAGYVKWFKSAQKRLLEGVDNKVVLPRVLVKRLLPQINDQIVEDVSQSIFHTPIANFPPAFTNEEKDRLSHSYADFIKNNLIPAYQELGEFLENQYLPNTRSTDGYGSMPNGYPWYQYLANKHTTTTMLVEDIHQLGLSEVKRILDEMEKVRQSVNFDGDLSEFFTHLSQSPEYYFTDKQDLINGYMSFKNQIERVLPEYFDSQPKAAYVVKAVESFREKSAAGASYSAGSPDGIRPGVFYVNTYNLKAQPKWGMMTLSLHEAAPGHHFQISLSQELDGVPMFQKFGDQTAFVEGWALYSEHLGIEMGLFKDPYQYFGKLADEMLRAMRLVVDTGLHAKGWSRAQAIAYMLANSTMAKSDVIAEVERYMAIPGQALSYKIGQLKIMELRQLAEKELGKRFDIKEFHDQVLLDGALPLSVLEQKINLWINDTKASSP